MELEICLFFVIIFESFIVRKEGEKKILKSTANIDS